MAGSEIALNKSDNNIFQGALLEVNGEPMWVSQEPISEATQLKRYLSHSDTAGSFYLSTPSGMKPVIFPTIREFGDGFSGLLDDETKTRVFEEISKNPKWLGEGSDSESEAGNDNPANPEEAEGEDEPETGDAEETGDAVESQALAKPQVVDEVKISHYIQNELSKLDSPFDKIATKLVNILMSLRIVLYEASFAKVPKYKATAEAEASSKLFISVTFGINFEAVQIDELQDFPIKLKEIVLKLHNYPAPST